MPALTWGKDLLEARSFDRMAMNGPVIRVAVVHLRFALLFGFFRDHHCHLPNHTPPFDHWA